jgi:hypothetical protein
MGCPFINPCDYSKDAFIFQIYYLRYKEKRRAIKSNMSIYANAKIYQVISPNHPLPYIGSTTQPLCKRMAKHRLPSNSCSSRIVVEAGDAYIELIEEFPCENREQLNKREGEMIRERACVNRCVAGRTRKEYYEANKEEIKAYQKAYSASEEGKAQKKAYYETHKEQTNAYQKVYRASEEVKVQKKAYYEAHKEQLKAYQKAKYASKKDKASEPTQRQEQEHPASHTTSEPPPTIDPSPQPSLPSL